LKTTNPQLFHRKKEKKPKKLCDPTHKNKKPQLENYFHGCIFSKLGKIRD
jgi:hypothetical protein